MLGTIASRYVIAASALALIRDRKNLMAASVTIPDRSQATFRDDGGGMAA